MAIFNITTEPERVMGTSFLKENSPIISEISFYKVIESLERLSKSKDKIQASYAKELLKEIEPFPELKEGFTDFSLLEKYKEPIDKLCKVLFPEALLNNEIKGVMAPFDWTSFYNSTRFQDILDHAGPDFSIMMKDIDEDKLHIIASSAIINRYFNMPVSISKPYILEIPDSRTGRMKYYRMAFNVDLMEPFPTDKAVMITKEDHRKLVDNFDDVDLWKEKFPPQSWIMRGIGIINLTDITMDYSVASVSSSLLVKDKSTLDKVQNSFRNLFEIDDLEMGFVSFDNENFFQIEKAESKSILLKNRKSVSCSSSMCPNDFNLLIKERKPIAISNVKEYYKESKTSMAKILMDEGINSYLIIPLEYEDEVQGYLEIASKRNYELNSSSFNKISDLLPIMSMAAARFQEDHVNLIEAVIQQECTTIHNSVKWKFKEEAEKHLIDQERGLNPVFKDIVFKDIFALYGQMDIKGSSARRNNAVVTDLVTQLKSVKKILLKTEESNYLPAYDELIYRVDSYMEDLHGGLLASSENSILSFLKSEIFPVIEHIRNTDKTLDKYIERVTKNWNHETGVIYEARRDFDESVTQVNEMMAKFIDEKQLEAQSMFPHYFERYKTDGLEYNMYIGQSIVKDRTFNDLYLKNLRLWQMMTMCEMENEFIKLQKDLKVKIEVASLVLVYNTPLSIHFRMDEKKFDVEGAYNARYEIVKKRIDKAHIKGTDERITTPGKIAIIYSNDQDKMEYLKYINFLVHKGYIKDNSIEEYQLEDLSGITGLKALRVEVNYAYDSEEGSPMTYDELVGKIFNS